MNWLGLFLISVATLTFEINLTRIFSVVQFYHFAFMSVSLALLGFGASGTVLSLIPGLVRHPRRTLVACSLGFALTAVGSYALTLLLPFDSFRVALEPRQWGVLTIHYLALATPFLGAGTAVGLLLAAHPDAAGRTYAANLAGSAAGCALAVAAPAWVGAEGVVFLSAALAAAAAICFSLRPGLHVLKTTAPSALVALAALLLAFRLPSGLEVRLSPYKGLSYTLLYPDAELVFRRWNGFSRVDVVQSTAIRSMPGQGFACPSEPPRQRGLFVDGDNLSPITQASDPADLRPLTDCLLTALPYRLRPDAQSLVLNPRGGFDVLLALAEGASAVTAVEPNPLVIQAVREQGAWAGHLYDHPHVRLFVEDGRAYLARRDPRFDVVFLPSPGTYHPVTSGAYSLSEDNVFTVEGFVAALGRLEEDGILAVVRWLQVPPSESLRSFALAVEAMERSGADPDASLVALRSYNQMLILARRGPFTESELRQVRAFASARLFDLVYAPDIVPEETNLYNVLPSSSYYEAFVGFLRASDREAWLAAYPFDVSPPTDDRPFFAHFFRWQQARAVLEMAGHVWQPFGGAGYLVLLAVLAIGTAAAAGIVLLPLAGLRSTRSALRGAEAAVRLAPFGFLGLAYLLVEIPLLQRFILFLGQPVYAMATVLGTLLLFSGLGSMLAARVRPGRAMAALVGSVVLYRSALPLLSGPLLALPLAGRIAVTGVGLAPLGILMGMPFPRNIALLQQKAPGAVPWAWGVNGALSVVASVLAVLVAITWGFAVVLTLGALCYAGAWISEETATRIRPRARAIAHPDP